jgi:hypothetical protein
VNGCLANGGSYFRGIARAQPGSDIIAGRLLCLSSAAYLHRKLEGVDVEQLVVGAGRFRISDLEEGLHDAGRNGRRDNVPVLCPN